MQFSEHEISSEFDVPQGIVVHRAALLPATKAKPKPRAEISFSVGNRRGKKNKVLPQTGNNIADFRTAVADLIASLELENFKTTNDLSEMKLRPKEISSEPEKKTDHGGFRSNSGRKSKAYKLKLKRRTKTISKLGVARKRNSKKLYRSKKKAEKAEKALQERSLFVRILQKAADSSNFSNVFDGKILDVSHSQISRLGKQVLVALAFYKMRIENPTLLKELVYQRVAESMTFSISARTVMRWVQDFEASKGKFSESAQGRYQRTWILNDPDLKNRAINFLKDMKRNEDENLTVAKFQDFLNSDLLVNNGLDLQDTFGLEIPISWETSRVWMHNLGFHFKAHSKNVYCDGHDRPDVIEHREGYVKRHFEESASGVPGYFQRGNLYLKFSREVGRQRFGFDEETLEVHALEGTEYVEFNVDDFDFSNFRDEFALGGSPSVKLNTNETRPIILIFQDEAIYKAFDASRRYWQDEDGSDLRKKGEGPGIMVSGFINEEEGFMSLSKEEFEMLQLSRQELGKPPAKYFTEYNGRFYPSIHLFEYGKDREGYWTGDDMVLHTDEFLDALEFKYPGYQFVLIFDWSSGHAKYPAGAPNVTDMNVNFGGKQGIFRPAQILEDYTYPDDFPAYLPRLKKGDLQHMLFLETDHPPFYRPNLLPAQYVGKQKGLKQVLYERGLYVPGMTEKGTNGNSDDQTSLTFVLSECLDFKLQKSALQEHIENRGHICDFLAKYHPELSPIERSWAMSKKYFRGRCKFTYADMLVKIRKSLLDPLIHPLKMIRRFFRKTRDYLRAYQNGSTTFNDVKIALKKYKGHRVPPPSESTDEKYKPFQKKKALKERLLLKERFDSLFLCDDLGVQEQKSSSTSVMESNNPQSVASFVNDFAVAMSLIEDGYSSDYDLDLNLQT